MKLQKQFFFSKKKRGRPQKTFGQIALPISLDRIFEENGKIMQIDDFSKIPIAFMKLTKNMREGRLSEIKSEQVQDDPRMWTYLRDIIMKVGEDRRKKFWMVLLEKTAKVLFWSQGMIKDVCNLIILYDELKSGEYLFFDDLVKSIIKNIKNSPLTKFVKLNILLDDEYAEMRINCEKFIEMLVKCFDEWEFHFERFK